MKRARKEKSEASKKAIDTALRACLIAKDAAFNARDYLATGSRIAYLAVRQCEKELDQIERQVDDATPAAVTQVPEAEARELLACLKFTIDLERIGDLIWSVVQRIHGLPAPLNAKESAFLIEMAQVLQEMLARVHQGFVSRDLGLAESVIKMDYDMDQVCSFGVSAVSGKGRRPRSYEVTNLLFMAQAFERAGDHTKNLAEELFHLVQGHSVRHIKKSRQGRSATGGNLSTDGPTGSRGRKTGRGGANAGPARRDVFVKITRRGGIHGRTEGTGVGRLAAESGANGPGQPTETC